MDHGDGTATEFDAIASEIAAAHDRLGHTLGWRFLYGPSRTLAPGTRLALVGLNPGVGPAAEPSRPSVEAGNAYRLERWSRNRRSWSALQVQLHRLYEALAHRLSAESDLLMDETLSVNFCPFRSARWAELHSRRQSIAFSHTMWSRVLDVCQPRAIICFGADAGKYLAATLETRGARHVRAHTLPTGWNANWGPVLYSLHDYKTSSTATLLVRLPHLGQYKIFGRSSSPRLADEIAAPIAEALLGSTSPG